MKVSYKIIIFLENFIKIWTINLNKAVSHIDEILIKYINENHHLKEMLVQHDLMIKKLETPN